jgi:hypothetical protein
VAGGSLWERNPNRWKIGSAIAFVLNTMVLIKISETFSRATARAQHGFLQPPKMSQQPPSGQKVPLLQTQPKLPPRQAG